MTDKHTKEPWVSIVDDSGTGKWAGWPLCITQVKDEDKSVVRTGGQWPYDWDTSTSQDEAVANANRIVACVNALEGIENPKEFMQDVLAYVTHPSNMGHRLVLTHLVKGED